MVTEVSEVGTNGSRELRFLRSYGHLFAEAHGINGNVARLCLNDVLSAQSSMACLANARFLTKGRVRLRCAGLVDVVFRSNVRRLRLITLTSCAILGLRMNSSAAR